MNSNTLRSGEAEARAAGQLLAPVAAILIGVVIVFGAGFAEPALLHNSAHDARHAFVFPCH